MATKPLVLPEKFSGDGEWTQWICHFENVAAVNKWDDENKLLWLKVRLTERAQLAFQHLTPEAQANYERAKEALKARFEPPSRKDLYKVEFQSRRKKKGEGWADFAEDLKILIDKAYPDLEAAARDQMALTHYLSQIDNPQVAFSVKQQKPATLDAAVGATLEMESYMEPRSNTPPPVGAVHDDSAVSVMTKLLDRMDKLEVELAATRKEREEFMAQRGGRAGSSRPNYRADSRRNVTCWNCGRRGHVIRDCRNGPNPFPQGYQHQPPPPHGFQQHQQGQGNPPPLRGHQHQGNGSPSMDGANH